MSISGKRALTYLIYLVVPGIIVYGLSAYMANESDRLNCTIPVNPSVAKKRMLYTACPDKAKLSSLNDLMKKDSYWYYDPKKISEIFVFYNDISEEKQFQLITEASACNSLSGKVKKIFYKELMDKSRLPIFRNNAAMGLMKQLDADKELEYKFLSMLSDTTETSKWRSYCIQFYAESSTFSDNPQKILANLKEIAFKGGDDFAPTAIVGIKNYKKIFKISDKTIADILLYKLKNQNDSERVKACIYGVFASLDDIRGIKAVREGIADLQDKYAIIAAVGTLGHRGEATDINLISPFYKYEDYRVREVVAYNIKHLLKKHKILEDIKGKGK